MCDDHTAPPPSGLDRRGFLRTTGVAAAVVTASSPMLFEQAAAGRAVSRTYTGTFLPGTAPDWHYIPVDVPAGVRRIEVSYDYTGQPLSGVGTSVNVVDIGIFDPAGTGLGEAAGFRGWSGGARRSFAISRSAATPGYLPGPVGPGRWHVILGPVAITPPGVDWTVTVRLVFGARGPAFEPAPAPRSVPGTGRRWYRGDLHLHTVHSDGRRTPEELARAAQTAGLDFVASTEHNTSSAALVWGRHTPADLLVINGEEVTTREGHWLAVGLPAGTWVDWRYRSTDGALPRFTRQVRDLGGIAIAAHPWVPVPGTLWQFGFDHVDALEIWNGPWTLDDQFAVEQWHAQLAAGHYLPVVGSSDSHRDGQPVGLPQTVVLAETLSTGAVVAAVRAGRAWIAESASVDLDLAVTGPSGSATCGERLPAAPTDVVRVRLSVSGVPGCVATVRGAAGPVGGAAADDAGRIEVDVQLPAGATAFVRAEVRRPSADMPTDPTTGSPGGNMVALTNPVFLG